MFLSSGNLRINSVKMILHPEKNQVTKVKDEFGDQICPNKSAMSLKNSNIYLPSVTLTKGDGV